MKLLSRMIMLAAASILTSWITPAAAAICPTTSNTNTDCGYILTVQPDGSVTGAVVSGARPYDGSDDVLVGIVNDSSSIFAGNVTLSSSRDIFGFDGDGICTFTHAGYCSSGSAPTGYEGPTTSFSGINKAETSGTVNLTSGLDPGTSTYFSLENSPSNITTGGGITIVGVGSTGSTGGSSPPATGSTEPSTDVPEPATSAVMGLALSVLGLTALRRRDPV